MAAVRPDYRAAAERGDREAMYQLAECYYHGRGLPQDYTKAAAWYRSAADRAHLDATVCLGACYRDGHGVAADDAQAVLLFGRAAERGSALALSKLGYCYAYGRGLPQDYTRAVALFQQAVAKGEPQAMSNLGWCYMSGRGVVQDQAQAVQWFVKAAEKGDPIAMENLAACYKNGFGVATDRLRARAWFRKAAEQRARRRRGDGHGNSEGSPGDRPDDAEHVQARNQMLKTLEEQVSTQTHCPGCSQLFTAGAVLSMPMCLHAVCRNCVERQLAASPRLLCLTCQVEQPPLQTTPGKADRAFEPHPTVEEHLSRHRPVRCDQCAADAPEAEAKVEAECDQCRLALCEIHAAVHRTRAATRQHVLQPRPVAGAASWCTVHERPLEAYCQSCRVPICLQCLLTTHPANTSEHQTHLLDASLSNRLRGEICDALEKANEVQMTYVDQLILACWSADETIADVASAKEVVSTVFDELRQLLSRREATLRTDLANAQTEWLSAVEHVATMYNNRWVESASTVIAAREFASPDTDALVLARFQPKALASLQRLQSDRLLLEVPAAPNIQISFDPDLMDVIKEAGRLQFT